MIKSNPSSLLTSMGDDFVPTRADMESPATWKRLGDSQANERWQELLDHLIEWGSNAACLADDGIDPPSRDTVQWAAQVILALRDSGLRCPDSIVPDPNGGIVIEYGPRHAAMVFHVWEDGSIDRSIFNGTQLVERETL